MKQRLLLLMCVLATTLCAKAHTVTFDVKFGSFMTEKGNLTISISNELTDYNAEYDEATGKYVIHDVQAGKYDYFAYYKDIIPMREMAEINSDVTIPLDFTVFHKITFKAPEGYSMENAIIHFSYANGREDNTGMTEDYLYMPDGTYSWKANISNINDIPYLNREIEIQTFTVAGADKEVVYAINPTDYHKVTISLKGHDGQAVTPFNGYLYDDDGEALHYDFHSDANGKVIAMIKNGSYQYLIYSTEYSKKRGGFKVADADVNIQVSYEGYSKLTIQATGSMLSQVNDLSLDLVNYSNYDGGEGYFLNKISDTEYCTESYLAPTIFEYRVQANMKGNIKLLPQSGKIDLAKERTLSVDLSDYYPVTFTLSEENDTESEIDIITENGFTYDFGFSKVSNMQTIYMKPGNYTVKLSIDPDGEDLRYAYAYQNFTVGNKAQEVKLVYDASQYSMVTANLINVPDVLKPYTENLYIKLFSGTRIYADEVPEDGLFVPKGTYTYTALNGDCGMIPLKGTITVTGENDHIDLDFSQYGVTIIELEDTEGVEEDYDDFDIYVKGNGYMSNAWQDHDFGNAILLEPAGTYLVSAISHDNGSGEKSITITAGTVNRETVTIVPRQAGKYMVYFEIEDRSSNLNDEFKCTVSLQGYGDLLLTNSCGIFKNVNAAEGLKYTVSAPGYHTVTGTVNVNEENSDNGIVELYIPMRVDNSTGIETVQANSSFRVYPTVADDYINICADDQDETAWTIRMISATGSTVYMNKQILNGEEQIYVGNLPKGFYLLTLNNGEQRMTYKILKK